MQKNEQMQPASETQAVSAPESSSVPPVWTSGRMYLIIVTWLCRLLAGGVFLYSGFTKAVDPWGTVFKMEDYLAVMPDSIASFCMPLLTVGVFFLFSLEFLTGLLLITGAYRRMSAVSAGLLMIVMLPLTLWIALANPVADCGCFGDALILSNWATFWKNVVITLMAAWLIRNNKRCRCLVHPILQWLLFAGGLTYVIAIGFLSYSYQPLVDYRPYPVGGTMIDADMPDEDADMTAIWERNGERIEIPADSIPDDDDWTFVERKEVVSNIGKSADKPVKTKGIAIFDDSEEVTSDVIEADGEQVVVLMTNLPSISTGTFYKLNSLYSYCTAHEIPMMAVVAATPLQISDFTSLSLAEYPIYTAEDTAIKEIARGNPAVVYLENGKIVWKSSLQSIPTDDFVEDTPDSPKGLRIYLRNSDKWLNTLTIGLLSFVGLLMLLSHVPMVIRAGLRRRRNSRLGKYIKDGDIVKASLMAIAVSALCSCSDKKDEPQPEETNPQAVLIYMVGTNNLSYNADNDIKEMLEGYKSAVEHHTDFYIYLASPELSSPELQKIRLNGAIPEMQTVKTYSQETSSVDPTRISEVIADFRSCCDASRLGLILWSHATGWLPGTFAPPVYYSYGSDYGKTIGIRTLAEAIPQDCFDFIWADCCFMGNIETAYELRDRCRYYVASPTEVLAEGAPYQVVIPEMSKPCFSLPTICDAVADYYRNSGTNYYTVSITSTDALDEFHACAANILANDYPVISTAGLQTYGYSGTVRFYDLLQSYSRLAEANGKSISSFTEALDKVVIYKTASPKFINITINPANFSGLSCSLLTQLDATMRAEYEQLAWFRNLTTSTH